MKRIPTQSPLIINKPPGRKMAQEQQQYEHAAADWERWCSRVQDEIEAAQVSVQPGVEGLRERMAVMLR